MKAKKIQIILTIATADKEYDNNNNRLKSTVCISERTYRWLNIAATVGEKS